MVLSGSKGHRLDVLSMDKATAFQVAIATLPLGYNLYKQKEEVMRRSSLECEVMSHDIIVAKQLLNDLLRVLDFYGSKRGGNITKYI